jgi:hypothetical protein
MAGTIATVDDLPVQGIGQTIARLGVHDYLARYEATRRR